MTCTDWFRSWSDAGESEPPSCCFPCPSVLGLIEALRWFLANLDKAVGT
jgi:hypothetical protein